MHRGFISVLVGLAVAVATWVPLVAAATSDDTILFVVDDYEPGSGRYAGSQGFGFAREADTTIVAGDGSLVEVTPWRIDSDKVVRYFMADGQIVAVDREVGPTVNRAFTPPEEIPWQLCLLDHALRGASTHRSVEDSRACRDDISIGSPLSFHPKEGSMGDSLHSAVWDIRRHGEEIGTVRFAEGIPVPVELRWETTKGQPRSLTLTHYSDRLDEGRFPDGQVAVADVVMESRESWGPDETGIDHPFPLSEAFQAHGASAMCAMPWALGDAIPKLDLDLVSASYNVWGIDGPERSWMMYATDGTTVFSRTVREGDTMVSCWRETDREPPKELPSEMPSVASAWKMWSVFFSRADHIPNSWGFGVTCDASCGWRMTVGYQEVEYVTGKSGHIASSRIVFDADGLIWANLLDQEGSPLPPWDLDEAGNEASFLHPEAYSGVSVPLWREPAGAGLLAGLLGLIVGVVHYFWPTIRLMPGLALFSRIHQDKVPDHPARRLLLDSIRDDPGIHLSELARRNGAKLGTTRHHVNRLADVGLITARKDGGFTCFFPSGVNEATAVRSPLANRVLDLIHARPGINCSQAARKLGCSRNAVHRHVRQLVAQRRITAERQGRSLSLQPGA